MNARIDQRDLFGFMNSLNMGIVIIDKDFKVVFWNSWMNSRFDPSQVFVQGTSLVDLTDISERFVSSLSEARDFGLSSLLSNKINNMPFRLVQGGIALSYNLLISRMDQVENGQHDILIQVMDVTQVKQRESFIAEKQREIDQEREHSFNKERLVSLGELSSSVAHEINNPLAILSMNYKMIDKMMIKKGIMFPELHELIVEGRQTIERMIALISSVKNLARNPEHDSFSNFPLSVILNDVFPVLKAQAHTEGVEIRFDLSQPGMSVPIKCLRILLGQVFVNLINNSFYELKKHKEKWVEIKTKVVQDFLEISVTDSGNGIPLHIRDKIFLPFYTTKNIGEGTGLGLSTVHKIITNHRGKIRVDESNPHTSFIISIPLK